MKRLAARPFLAITLGLIVLTLILPACESSNDGTTSPYTVGPSPGTPSITSPSPSTTTPPITSPSPTVTIPSGIDIPFESVISSTVDDLYKDRVAKIIVITSTKPPLPEGITWVNEVYRDKITSLDFSQYYVIMALNGWRGVQEGIPFQIKRIRQDGKTISILTHFDDPRPGRTVLPMTYSPYEIIKIPKDQMLELGEITFRLLDESGQERAITSHIIQ